MSTAEPGSSPAPLVLYADANFLWDLVQGRDRNSDRLRSLIDGGRIPLRLPRPCLWEPVSVAAARRGEFNRLANEVKQRRSDLARSSRQPYSDAVASLDAAYEQLNRVAAREEETASTLVEQIEQVATILPLTPSIIQRATEFRLDPEFGLEEADALILATVIEDAPGGNAGRACFLTHDRDFDQPAIKRALDGAGIELLFESGAALAAFHGDD